MRIICPNCEALYEIEAEAIPPGGRDVQCSACGHNWFQLPEHVAAGLPPQEYDDLPEDIAAAEEAEAPEPDEAPRPSLDPALRAFLRKEAEREAAARRSEAQADADVETEPAAEAEAEPVGAEATRADAAGADAADAMTEDATAEDASEHDAVDDLLFKTAPMTAAPETQEAPEPDEPDEPGRNAEAAEAEPEHDPVRSPAGSGDGEARAPLAARTRAPDPAAPAAQDAFDAGHGPELALDEEVARRRGFRMGFIGMLLIAGGALWLYVYGRGMPDPGPFLTGYVETMETGRVVLVERLDGAVDALVRLTIGD